MRPPVAERARPEDALDVPDQGTRLLMWRYMYLERLLSETLDERVKASGQALMNKTLGQRRGQEAVMVGFCLAFRRGADLPGTDLAPDLIGGFAGKHLIPMGLDLGRIVAEAFGRSTGWSGGRSGPGSSIFSAEHGLFPHIGLIGADCAHGVGLGFAAKWNGRGQVAGSITSDGGSNTGRFHESLNLAALHRLPVVFACVNNWYATNMSVERSVATGSIAGRSGGYGVPSIAVDGQDVLACWRASTRAVERARRGDGPTLLEFQTYRYDGEAERSEHDPRPHAEFDAWLARDPIPMFRSWLLANGHAEADLGRVEEECARELDRAFAFALSGPVPEAHAIDPVLYSPLPELAYVDEPAVGRAPAGGRERTFAQALAEAQAHAMRRDRRVVLMGLNVGRYGSIDGHAEGLWEEFGDDRVLDMPIVQATYTGACAAAAMVGYRPIVIAGSPAIAMAAADELYNVLPNARFMSGGTTSVPIVVRIGLTGPGGGRFGDGQTFGAVQSAALHAFTVHVPGVYVAAPSTPYDAKGLLATAVALDDPVFFIEHRGLMRAAGPVPEDEYFIPFGKAAVRRRGSDATLVAISWMVPRTLAAAELLARDGIDVEVIDPRTLVPLDTDTILASVERTGCLITVDQGFHRLNVGSEIIASAHERLGPRLRRSYRISAPDSPVPAAAALSGPSYPTPSMIAASVREVVGRRDG